MAKIEFPGIDEYSKMLAELGKRSEGLCKAAVYDGAAVVADAVRAEFNRYQHPDSEGELMRSLALATMRNDDGYINTKIMFPGYDSRGTPNPLKANVLEGGTSRVKAKPFIRPAVSKVKKAAVEVMRRTLDKMLAEIDKK